MTTLLKFLAHFMTSVFQKKIKLKPLEYNNPWIIKGIKKWSKENRTCTKNSLKTEIKKNEKLYKSYNSLFELKTTQRKHGVL